MTRKTRSTLFLNYCPFHRTQVSRESDADVFADSAIRIGEYDQFAFRTEDMAGVVVGLGDLAGSYIELKKDAIGAVGKFFGQVYGVRSCDIELRVIKNVGDGQFLPDGNLLKGIESEFLRKVYESYGAPAPGNRHRVSPNLSMPSFVVHRMKWIMMV